MSHNRTYDTIRVRKVERFVKARRLVVRLVLFGAVTGGAVFGGIQLKNSESLAIKRILVEGTGTERADEIRALLNVKTGDNLLFADLSLARTRAESHPWVSRAGVKRELPDTLRIVVEERVPKMILALDRLYYLDAAGEPFKLITPGDEYDLPVLTGLDREDLLSRAEIARDAIAGGLSLADALSAKDASLPLSEVSEIAWDEDEGYAVISVSGKLTVRFGNGEWVEKLARLREVRSARGTGGTDVSEIDLTYSSRVIVAR